MTFILLGFSEPSVQVFPFDRQLLPPTTRQLFHVSRPARSWSSNLAHNGQTEPALSPTWCSLATKSWEEMELLPQLNYAGAFLKGLLLQFPAAIANVHSELFAPLHVG